MTRTLLWLILGIAVPVAAGVCVLFYVTWGWTTWRDLSALAPGSSLNSDFAAFWGAARLALAGDWTAAFDPARLSEARNLAPGAEETGMLWLYPPGYLWLMLPFGRLEFATAWAIFALAGWGAFALATLRWFGWPGDWRGGLLLAAVLGGPAVVVTVVLGQNTLFFVAAMLFGLGAMRAGRPALAGACFALLSLKPQLALALLVALIAAGQWRTIAWAVGWAVLAAAATLIQPGWGYWTAFFEATAAFSAMMGETGIVFLIVTPAGSLHALDLHALAPWSSLVLAVAAALAIFRAWRAPDLPVELRLSVLLLGTLMMAPYAVYYELVFAALAGAALVRAAPARDVRALMFAAVLWYLPIAGYYAIPRPGFAFVSPILIAAFGYLCWRLWTWPREGGARRLRAAGKAP